MRMNMHEYEVLQTYKCLEMVVAYVTQLLFTSQDWDSALHASVGQKSGKHFVTSTAYPI